MHLNKFLHRSITVFISAYFLFSIIFIFNTSADDNNNGIVDASFNIEIVTGTYLKISVTLDVQEITVFGSTYDKNGIHAVSNNDPETMGAIKLRLLQILRDQIKSLFNDVNILILERKPTYENFLFYDEFYINLTSEFFGLNETINIYDFINGILDMDAVVYYTFNLNAEPGWNNNFTIILPETITYRYTTGSVDNNIIQWEVKNRDGKYYGLPAELSIKKTEPTTPKILKEEILLEFELDASKINNNALKITILVKSVDILEYNILPDFVSELQFVTADGIRLFIYNGFFSWNDFYLNTIEPIEQNTKSNIEFSSFNQTLELSFSWDPVSTTNCSMDDKYNITKMDVDPPLKVNLIDDDIQLYLFEISPRAFFGLVNAGAIANISKDDINFGEGLDKIAYPYNIFLHLPNNISLGGENIYNWNSSSSLSGEFISELIPDPYYSDEHIETLIEIVISKLDLDLLSFFSGNTKLTATSNVKEDNKIYLMSIPQQFDISKKINLSFLNSDAFRLCIEEEVFDKENVDFYLKNKKDAFEKRISEVLNNFKINGVVDKGAFYDSLKWNGDISNMDHDTPVVVTTYANNIYSIDFDLIFWPPEISISNQTFNLYGINNQSVKYRILFPKGISINVKDSQNKSMLKGKTLDGNEYIELSFKSNEATEFDLVLAEISVSPVYTLGLFLPCIISLVLLIILMVLFYIIRKKKKGGKIIKEDADPSEYEGQDYYVPPPPRSK